MKKIKIDTRVEKFFKTNTAFLEDNYPGINLKRIAEEFNYYLIISNEAHHFFEELLKRNPLEYITKHKFFYNFDFYVDERVLIPRFDSESMVFECIETILQKDGLQSLCEVGVGSGCLSLSILNEAYPKIEKLTVTDISKDALEVFKINQDRVCAKINFSSIDTFEGDRLFLVKEKFDMIISNPPYIAKKHLEFVHPNVHQFEPHIALYLEDETYLNWFEVFFKQVYDCLNDNGLFFMEGHEKMLNELKELASKYFASCEVKKDLAGSDRYLKIQK